MPRSSSWSIQAAALRESHAKVACVVGGGVCGLACAIELGKRGYAVCIVDPDEPGAAPASSAAAGLLDPLTPKGKLMWHGEAAFEAACALIRTASDDAKPCFATMGSLHVANNAKHASQLSTAADEADYVHWLGASAFTDETSAIELDADVRDALLCGVSCPHGALFCRRAMVVDTSHYLMCLWRMVQATTTACWLRKKLNHTWAIAGVFDLVIVAVCAPLATCALLLS